MTREKAFTRERDGVYVRPLTLADASAFLAAVRESIEPLSYWMPWCTPDYALPDAEAWMRFCEAAWSDRIEYPLGIFDSASDELIGGAGINHVNATWKIGNIGYWVRSSRTGQGAARAAAYLAAQMGFSELGFTRLEIVVLERNTASQHVAESLGARKECVARNRLYFQGSPCTAVVYSLIPGDLADS